LGRGFVGLPDVDGGAFKPPPASRRPMAGLRAVLWDLDGTLLESHQSIRETMNAVLAERGLPTFAPGELKSLVGQPLRVILATKCMDQAVVESMALRYREVYNERAWVTVTLHAGMEGVLAEVAARGTLQAIVTSKGEEEARTLLFDLGILDHFQTVVGDDDVRPLKPDPAPVVEACRRLGVAPADAVMVGDTPFDVTAGRGAGVRTIGVLWGTADAASLRAAGAHDVCRDARALSRVLRG
jgi:2-phosphoglycolate phosphatase